MATPAERCRLTIGDKIVLIPSGQVLELILDDGSAAPRFRNLTMKGEQWFAICYPSAPFHTYEGTKWRRHSMDDEKPDAKTVGDAAFKAMRRFIR